MATATNSKPGSALNANMKEVRQLLSIHKEIAGNSPGRKHNVEILNKSAIVLCVACWEAFIEDACETALEFSIANASTHKVFPEKVLARIASKHTGANAWDLAGDGWQQCMKDNLKEVLARTTGTLNTPRTIQVDDLFLKTLGVPEISKSWSWPGKSNAAAKKALDDLITLRGAIAHRVATESTVRKKYVESSIGLVFRLSVKTGNAVRGHVHKMVGKYPWPQGKFKKTM